MLITRPDRDRLVMLLRAQHPSRSIGTVRSKLLDRVNTASIVMPTAIPETVVTMGSIVRLIDITTGQIMTCRLVYPAEANVDALKISVLAPLGSALIGQSEGEIIEFSVPAGTKRYFIQKVVYQPEAHAASSPPGPSAA